MVKLRQYQTKHKGIKVRRKEILATNGSLISKGRNIRTVRKIMLLRADLLGLGNRIADEKTLG
jgi:hypothetical protein